MALPGPAAPLALPVTARHHPEAGRLTRHAQEWAERFELINGAEEAGRLARGAPARLAAAMLPDAAQPEADLAACWMTWTFFLDDAYEEGPGGTPTAWSAITDLARPLLAWQPAPPGAPPLFRAGHRCPAHPGRVPDPAPRHQRLRPPPRHPGGLPPRRTAPGRPRRTRLPGPAAGRHRHQRLEQRPLLPGQGGRLRPGHQPGADPGARTPPDPRRRTPYRPRHDRGPRRRPDPRPAPAAPGRRPGQPLRHRRGPPGRGLAGVARPGHRPLHHPHPHPRPRSRTGAGRPYPPPDPDRLPGRRAPGSARG